MRRSLFSAALVVTVVLALAPAATARTIHCGDAIAKNTTLHADIKGCETIGLMIGADNITLDLNGHTISGQGRSDGIIVARHTGVKIVGGTVRKFANGIHLIEATQDTVTHMTGKGSNIEIEVEDSTGNTISHNTLIPWELGNGGISLDGSSGNTIAANHSSGGFYGIALDGSDSNDLEHNVAHDEAWGFFLSESNHNTLTHNVANADGAGFVLQTATDTNLLHNTASHSSTDGIKVESDSPYTVLDGNTTGHNKSDGIIIQTRTGSFVQANHADHNGKLGIEAPSGTSDAGDNEAHGNGDPAQCVGVSCA